MQDKKSRVGGGIYPNWIKIFLKNNLTKQKIGMAPPLHFILIKNQREKWNLKENKKNKKISNSQSRGCSHHFNPNSSLINTSILTIQSLHTHCEFQPIHHFCLGRWRHCSWALVIFSEFWILSTGVEVWVIVDFREVGLRSEFWGSWLLGLSRFGSCVQDGWEQSQAWGRRNFL